MYLPPWPEHAFDERRLCGGGQSQPVRNDCSSRRVHLCLIIQSLCKPLLVAGVLVFGQFIQGKAEFLVDALKFGAEDCSFCHSTASGGEARNELGNWLVEEKFRRNASEIDVDWLKHREQDVVLQEPEAEVKAKESLPSHPPEMTDRHENKVFFDFSTNHGEWPAYSGDAGAKKFSPLSQITLGNVKNLRIAWVWRSEIDPGIQGIRRGRGDQDLKAPHPFKGTPLMVDGRVLVRTRYSQVVALDPTTGERLWFFDPGTKDGPTPPMFGFSTRGLGYHKDQSGARVVLLTTDGWLYTLDPETGQPIESFGNAGRVSMETGLRRHLSRRETTWSNAPSICENIIVVGSQTNDASHFSGGRAWRKNVPLGDVRGFDVHTGKQLWIFKTVPQENEFGNDTWGDDSWKWMGNTNVWSMTSCDLELGVAYLPVSAPTHHFFGGFRLGDNLFGTSLVAVDLKTGKRVWHFQTVHHDIWDYDLPAAPLLADIEVNGAPLRVVAQVAKTGFLFVFNRETGEPIWPIEEREVPGSALPDEQASPTQPFPTWPPPFEDQGVTEADLNNLSPQLNNMARRMAGQWSLGPLFMPISPQGTLLSPGVGGGANWGGAAFDPRSGHLFVASRRMPTIAYARPTDRLWTDVPWRVEWSSPDIQGVPILNPPWSKITAYDLNTGSIAWTVPNGTGPKDHPLLRGLEHLPDLGDVGQAPGLLVTPGLVFHGSANRELTARSTADGSILWSGRITGRFSDAAPMTYFYRGRQFVLIGTGDTLEPSTITAFALP